MKYFGTDGIRGMANATLTVDIAFKLGKGLKYLNSDTVVIGTDTRLSKDMLVSAVAAGAMSQGINVINMGVVPTPTLIFYTSVKHIAGVMITASHNPYYDNGLKVVYDGSKLNPELEGLIENAIDNEIKEYDSDKLGKYIEVTDYFDEYNELLKKVRVKTNLNISLDTANGATTRTAEAAFKDVTNNLHVMANEPNGTNINNGVGSTHIENLVKFVLENKSDVGFAFDGDGDRVLAVDKTGTIIDGDKLIYIIANYLKKQNKLNNNKVVFSKMSNLGIINDLKEKNIDCVLTDVGDKWIVKALFEQNLSVGGENSGHIIVPSILNTGDGVLIAMLITKIMSEENKSLLELTSSITMYPDKTVNLRVKDKNIYKEDVIQNRVNELINEFGTKGKIIVRASGTENLLRVTVSHKDESIMKKVSDELVNLIKVESEK